LQGEWNLDLSKGYQFRTELDFEKGKQIIEIDSPSFLGGTGNRLGPMEAEKADKGKLEQVLKMAEERCPAIYSMTHIICIDARINLTLLCNPIVHVAIFNCVSSLLLIKQS